MRATTLEDVLDEQQPAEFFCRKMTEHLKRKCPDWCGEEIDLMMAMYTVGFKHGCIFQATQELDRVLETIG